MLWNLIHLENNVLVYYVLSSFNDAVGDGVEVEIITH